MEKLLSEKRDCKSNLGLILNRKPITGLNNKL